MSIVPVGRNKHQVNQGGFKHESMLNTDVFAELAEKFALAPGTVLDKQQEAPNVPDDLQSAMDQGGGLNPERGMPEGADMGGSTSANPDDIQMGGQFGDPQSQTSMDPMAGGGFEESLEAQFGPRVARIVGSFLNELRQAEMMSASFFPDPMGTKFTIGEGGLELKVPGADSGKIVEKV